MTWKHKPNKPFPSVKLILIRKFIKATEQGLELVPGDPALSRASTLFLPSILTFCTPHLLEECREAVASYTSPKDILETVGKRSTKTGRYLLAGLSLRPIMKCLPQGPLGLISILEDF